MTRAAAASIEGLQEDWGLLYGFGLFETMRVYDGVPFLLDEHVSRMARSAADIGLAGYRADALVDDVRRFCARFQERVVRVTVTGGNPDRGLSPRVLLAERSVPYTAADRASGIPVTISQAARDERSTLHRHKTLNQCENLLSWRVAVQRGCREALFFNHAGHLAEGSRSNIFVIRDGKARTPSLDCGLLPGVTRRFVIDQLRRSGIDVEEARITRNELFTCDACFLTSAVMEVMPISGIDGVSFREPASHAVTRLAASAYSRGVRRALAQAEGLGWRPKAIGCPPARVPHSHLALRVSV